MINPKILKIKMKKYSEEKGKIISQWGEPRVFEGKDNSIEYVFNRVNKGIQYTTIHIKTIWVYEDIIFNKKKDMITYIKNKEMK